MSFVRGSSSADGARFLVLSASATCGYVAPIRSLPSTRVLAIRRSFLRHFGDGPDVRATGSRCSGRLCVRGNLGGVTQNRPHLAHLGRPSTSPRSVPHTPPQDDEGSACPLSARRRLVGRGRLRLRADRASLRRCSGGEIPDGSWGRRHLRPLMFLVGFPRRFQLVSTARAIGQ